MESDMQLVNIPTGLTYTPRRIGLRYLTKVPWRTTNVLTVKDFKTLFDPDHFIQPFLSTLLEQEALLMDLSTPPARMLRRLMDWEPRDRSGGDDPILSTIDNHLNFTCAYHVVDVLSVYDGLSRPPTAEQRPKNPKLPVLAKGLSFPSSSKKKWIDMSDLQAFLHEGVKALSELEDKVPFTSGRVLRPLQHLTHQLSVLQSHGKGLTVVRNILMTSAMLLCISTTFKPMTIHGRVSIDADDDSEWDQIVLDVVKCGGMSDNDVARTKRYMQTLCLGDMAKPLRLSLLISSTILFSTRLLSNTRYDKVQVLEHSIELGNLKPTLLSHAESLIWKTVLAIAKGDMDGMSAIKDLIRNRFWSNLFFPDIADRGWFSPATHDVELPVADSLDGMDTEAAVHASSGRFLMDAGMDDDIQDIEMEEPESESEGGDGPSSELKDEHDADIDEGDGKQSTIGQDEEEEMNSTGVGEENEEGSSRSEVDDEHEHEMDSTVDEENDQSKLPSEEDDQKVPDEEEPEEGVKLGLHHDESDAGSDSSSHRDDIDQVGIDILPSPRAEQFFGHDVADTPEVPDHEQVGNDDYTPSEGEDEDEDEDEGSQLEVAAQKAKTGKNPQRTPPIPVFRQSNSAERMSVPLRSTSHIDVDMLVIDVDMLDEKPLVNLDINESPPKVDAPRELVGFDALGRKHPFTPRLHESLTINGEKMLSTVINIASVVENGYVAGAPLHIANPDESVLRIMTDAEYRSSSIDHIQNILRTKHILLTDLPKSEHRFDENGLRTLCSNLKEVFTVQDQSQPIINHSCLKQGNLRQILECSRMNDGKILDVLPFPIRDAAIRNEPFASDLASWNNTFAEPICKQDSFVPIQGIRCGHCATSGAFQDFHINHDGRGEFIEVLHGSKWYILPTNCHGLTEFPDDNFDFQMAAEYHRELEAVMLVPGTRLIIRPFTPKAIFTESHSFSRSGYFYAISTLKDTLLGIIYTLVAPTSIPNNTHPSALPMIRRMVIFVYKALVERDLDQDDPDCQHVPHLKDFNSLIDFLSLVFLGLMSNALDSKTYQFPGKGLHDPLLPEELDLMKDYDLNSMDRSERTLCMYVRGLARELMEWVCRHYTLNDPDGDLVAWDKFAGLYFAQMLYPIFRSSSQLGVQDERLELQIHSVFTDDYFFDFIIDLRLDDPNNPEYKVMRDVSVVQHSVPVPPIYPLSSMALIDKGRSEADVRYENGVRSNFSSPPVQEIDSDLDVDAPSKKRKRE